MSERTVSFDLSTLDQRARMLGWIYTERRQVARIEPVLTIVFEQCTMVGARRREVTSKIVDVVVEGSAKDYRINFVLNGGEKVSQANFLNHAEGISFPEYCELDLDGVSDELIELILSWEHAQQPRT